MTHAEEMQNLDNKIINVSNELPIITLPGLSKLYNVCYICQDGKIIAIEEDLI
jgi:hypothetical protein